MWEVFRGEDNCVFPEDSSSILLHKADSNPKARLGLGSSEQRSATPSLLKRPALFSMLTNFSQEDINTLPISTLNSAWMGQEKPKFQSPEIILPFGENFVLVQVAKMAHTSEGILQILSPP